MAGVCRIPDDNLVHCIDRHAYEPRTTYHNQDWFIPHLGWSLRHDFGLRHHA